MSTINKINIYDYAKTKNNIRNVLGCAVKNRKVFCKDIQKVDELKGATIEELKAIGFLNEEHKLNNKTYSITKTGDRYYKDIFGKYNYWGKRLSGLWDRVKADLLDRLSE